MPRKNSSKTDEPVMMTKAQYNKIKLEKLKRILIEGDDGRYNLEAIQAQIDVLEDRPRVSAFEAAED